jgi:5-hydroxyisourate hydrolase
MQRHLHKSVRRSLLYRPTDDLWQVLAASATNEDGRVPGLLRPGSLQPGLYRVRFDTSAYTAAAPDGAPFYPQPCIDFFVDETSRDQHFHIPLLLSPYAYSTYRGS